MEGSENKKAGQNKVDVNGIEGIEMPGCAVWAIGRSTGSSVKKQHVVDEVADCGSSDDGLAAVPDQIGARYEYLKAEFEAVGKQSAPKRQAPGESPSGER